MWIFELVISALFWILYSTLIFLIPGWVLSRRLKLNWLEQLILAMVIGFGSVSAYIYLLRDLGLPYWLIELPVLILSLWQLKKANWHRLAKFRFKIRYGLIGALMLAIALIHGSVLIQSAIPTDDGLEFVELSFHDSMQHISFIRRLHISSEVNHPGFAGSALQNYHYLVDSTLAAMTRFEFISLMDSYYRFYPVTISLIFSLSLWVIFIRLTKSRWAAGYGVVFTLFAGNASYWASYIRSDEYQWGSNSFIINPLIDILQNPASIFVLAQFILVIFGLHLYSQSKKQKVYIALVIGLMAGTMIGFKAWGGLIINFGLVLAAVWQSLRYRDFKLWSAVLISGLISAALFLPGYNPETSASPVWAPGWTLEQLIKDGDRWNNYPEIYQRDTFVYQQNYYQLIKLYAKWIGLYVLGNYWIRIVGLLAIGLSIFRIKNWQAWQVGVWTMTAASLCIPLLFNQGRMAYDIEQFSPYALLLASIATVVVLWKVLALASKRIKLSPMIWVGILVLILILAVPSNYTSLKARLLPAKRLITKAELELFDQVEQLTRVDSLILVYPSVRNVATLEFAAMTNRDTFYSGRTLSVITGEPFEQRYEQVVDLFERRNDGHQSWLENNQIDYIFVYADEKLGKFSQVNIELVYENQAGSLYKPSY